MMDAVHRILTGQTAHRWELTAAGIVVMAWFLMDLHQYLSWLLTEGCK